jgi:amino acid transporter
LLEGASVAGIVGGAALVFFAFIGFDDIVTLSDETREPEKTIPKALLLTLAISALLYVLVGVAAVSLVGAGALAASDRPLALVICHEWGAGAADIIAFIAVAATTNTTLLILTVRHGSTRVAATVGGARRTHRAVAVHRLSARRRDGAGFRPAGAD